MITNNFNTNINFLNSRDFGKKVIYLGTEVVDINRYGVEAKIFLMNVLMITNLVE